MTEARHGSHLAHAALMLAALAAASTCPADDKNVTYYDVGAITKRALPCADEHESSDDRIRACSAIIKDGGLRGRDLANMYIHRARVLELDSTLAKSSPECRKARPFHSAPNRSG
jgi:hypothetical protein